MLDSDDTGYPTEGLIFSGHADHTSLEAFSEKDTLIRINEPIIPLTLKMIYPEDVPK